MSASSPQFLKISKRVNKIKSVDVLGRVVQVVGLVTEADGPKAKIGDLCYIETPHSEQKIRAEVMGFRGDRVLLMPLGEMTGISAGCYVRNTGHCLDVPVGMNLLGRTLNGLGVPQDNLGPITPETYYPVHAAPPNALDRKLIEKPFFTGVRAIDSLITMGIGQRIGIFAGSGVGKSTLLGMIARNGQADVNVIVLVGERGREVREFIINDLGQEGLKKSVIVFATSDEPALIRIKAAMTGTAMAEYFRDQGLNVMLMMDSVTRFAMAQREVGLAVGEPPSTRGYTPSVFALLPKLMERAGYNSIGAITAIYTILVDGDDTNEPIADTTRSILDGHIVLSRKLNNKGHFPPIDVLHSLSRVISMITDREHVSNANTFREMIAAYEDVEDLISIGAYKIGSKPLADRVINNWDKVMGFIRQDKGDASSYEQTLATLKEIIHA